MDCEKKSYILNHFKHYIEEQVWNVMEDNPNDPEYSAVTAVNCIKCFIELCQEWSEKLPYDDVEGCLRCIGLTDDEYRIFEESRAKEAVYYIGKQY